MSSLKEHCDDCEKVLGEPFPGVHRWLDELFLRMGPKHRSARHHQGGVEQIRKMWGDKAAKAAEIHIKADWSWHPDYKGTVPTIKEAELWTIGIM